MLLAGLLIALTGLVPAQAQEPEPVILPDGQEQEEIVHCPAAFFARYERNTALDMVEQIPGFQLDDGGGGRGFGGAAGNILINGRRPSTKQDPPSAILERIPASRVERIELIRGQMAGSDNEFKYIYDIAFRQDFVDARVAWGWDIANRGERTWV